MTQQFNPRRVLRQISANLLKDFFEQQGHPFTKPLPSSSTPKANAAFDRWQRMDDQSRKTMEIILHEVDLMASEDGLRVIVEEANQQGIDISGACCTMILKIQPLDSIAV